MKKINTLLIAAALLSGLASCEMKEELIGKETMTSGEMGLLDLTVETNSSSSTVVTKAVTDVVEDFPVYIIAAQGDTTKRFESFAELQEQNPIELPVGTYTVVSNSPVPYERKMQYPYYKGQEQVTISEVQNRTTVTCTIQNVKITFVPSAAFRATYSDWTINVSDHKDSSSDALIKTFTPENSGSDTDQAFEYWKLDDNVDKIYISGTATVKESDETVQVYGEAEKKNLTGHTEADGDYFKGGDQLVIQLNPDKIEGSTAGVEKPGVSITISGFNAETNETITIEVTGDSETGTGGETGGETGEDSGEEPADPNSAITISDGGTGYLKNGVTAPAVGPYPKDVAVGMNVKNGIKSMNVQISGALVSVVSALPALQPLVAEGGMDLTSEAASGLSSLFTLPEAGATEYTFTMSETLFSMLGSFSGEHHFTLTVIDQDNNSQSATLTINITE